MSASGHGAQFDGLARGHAIKAEPHGKTPRLVGIDVIRGLTVAGMLVVNNPGSWNHVWWPLEHAAWHGCTPTDLVFPFFLFLVGVSIALSSRVGRAGAGQVVGSGGRAVGPTVWAAVRAAIVRGLVMVLLGLGLNLLGAVIAWAQASPRAEVWAIVENLRLPGVLQRIGVCYTIVAIGAILLPGRVLAGLGVVCLGAWWVLLLQRPMTPDANIVGVVDQAVLGVNHVYKHGWFDPEGVLSTLGAVGTVLLGLWMGHWLKASQRRSMIGVRVLVAGGLLMVSGLVAHTWLGMPMNKQLWTPSYVLFTGGCAIWATQVCILVCDWACHDARAERMHAWWYRAACAPAALGKNAMLAFVGSGVLARLLGLVRLDMVNVEGKPVRLTPPGAVFTGLARAGLPAEVASVAWALVFLGFWCVLLAWCDRKRWYWKV